MTTDTDDRLPHLRGGAALVAAASARPRRIAWSVLVLTVVCAWSYMALITAALGTGGTFRALGPGMSGLDYLSARYGLDAVALPALAAHPWLNRLAAICGTDAASWTLETVLVHASVWLAMAAGMMLPTAAPMLRTYAEIADTAAARGRRVVSPLVLACGYLTIWFAFALGATALQWWLGIMGGLSSGGTTAAAGLAAGLLALAGGYQFTRQKAACLVACSNPFPALFANWTETSAGVYRLGLREGLNCLGCCWALMLVMIAVGTMNLLWIVVLTATMTVEKLVDARWFSRAIGVFMVLWAAIVAVRLPIAGL